MGYPFLLPVGGQAENAAEHPIPNVVVEAQLHVILHREVVKQADVLKGTGNARPVHLDGVHAVGVLAVQEDSAPCGLIDLGEQVEHSGLARAVGADQARDLRAADGHIKLVDGGESAEINAQVAALQNGGLIHVPLRDAVGGGHGNQLGGVLFRCGHGAFPPFLLRVRSRIWPNKPLMAGLLVASMTRISTMA